MPTVAKQKKVVQSLGYWETDSRLLKIFRGDPAHPDDVCLLRITSERPDGLGDADTREVPVTRDTSAMLDVVEIVQEMTSWSRPVCRSIVGRIVLGLG